MCDLILIDSFPIIEISKRLSILFINKETSIINKYKLIKILFNVIRIHKLYYNVEIIFIIYIKIKS